MKKTINGKQFQITNAGGTYIIAKRDGEEYVVPYTRSNFKTLKGAIKRCEEIAGPTEEEVQESINQQEEVLEIQLFHIELNQGRTHYGKVDLTNREYDADKHAYIYNDGEIIFKYEEDGPIYSGFKAIIQQYFDGKYNTISRLLKKKDESLESFLLRAEELNEKLRGTICFEDR